MKIVVFGGKGQLGQCLKKVADERRIAGLVYLDEVGGNIFDRNLLSELLAIHQPDYVINCAAYTAVDFNLVNILSLHKHVVRQAFG